MLQHLHFKKVFLTGFLLNNWIKSRLSACLLLLAFWGISGQVSAQCFRPNGVSISNVSNNSATVNWNCIGCPANFIVEYGPAATFTTPGTGLTAGPGGTILNASGGSPVTITSFGQTGGNGPLNSATQYRVFVRRNCGNGIFSANSVATTFTTSCNPISQFPFTEEFNQSGLASSCWATIDGDLNSDTWQFGAHPFNPAIQGAIISGVGGVSSIIQNDYLVSPQLTLTGNEQLRFGAMVYNILGSSALSVKISTTGNSINDFTTQLLPPTLITSATSPQVYTVDLSGYTGNVYIAFVKSGITPNIFRLLLDFVQVRPIPSCPAPGAVSASSVTTSGAVLNWEVPDTSASTYTLEYGLQGFTPGSGVLIHNASSPQVIAGLTDGTTYDVYLKQHCSNGVISPVSGPHSFTTLTDCSVLSVTATSNSAVPAGDTILLTATGGTNNYTWTGPNGFISYEQNPQIPMVTSDNSGYYTVVANINGCILSAFTHVSVYGVPPQLSVNQTLPASTTNFTSLASLASYLNNNQLVGPVVVNVADGTGPYTGKLHLAALAGSSAENTVTINDNSNALTFCSGNPLDRDIVLLNGTDNITLQNFILNAPCGNGWGIHLLNGNENVSITGNTINLNETYSAYAANLQGIIAGNSFTAPGAMAGALSDIEITGNTINNGYNGIRINGNNNSWANQVTILGNTLTTTVSSGIVLSYANNVAIEENTVNMKNVGADQDIHSIGLQLSYIENGLSVKSNRVQNAGKQGIWLNYVNQTSNIRGLIANNIVGGGFRFHGAISLQLNFASHLDIFHNSVTTDFGDNGIGFYVSNAASKFLRAINNSFAYTGTGAAGRAMQAGTANNNFTQVDYNNYYSTGSQLAFFNGGLQNNLHGLQASTQNNIAAHNANSISVNPGYTNAIDLSLQPASALANKGFALTAVTTDINGLPRSSTPTIGAVEIQENLRQAGPPASFSVHPNPFESQFSIATGVNEGEFIVELSDVTGRRLYLQELTAYNAGNLIVKPETNLPHGIYFLQLSQNGSSTLLKVVKQ